MSSPSRTILELLQDRLLNGLATTMRARAVRSGRLSHIAVPIDDLIGIRLFSTGSFEQTQIDGIQSYVAGKAFDEKAVFVDVGANIGVYSIIMAKYFGRQYAIEANPITFKLLEANLELSRVTNTTLINIALSDRQGDATIYLPENGNLGWATLDAAHHDLQLRRIAVKSDTLDSVLATSNADVANVKLIKIDVEGHELSVLKGAVETIKAAKPALLCELLSDQYGRPLTEFLINLGYKRFSVFERQRFGWTLPVTHRTVDPEALHHEALVLAEF